MMRTLHEQYNAHLMISVWPKMSSRCSNYDAMNGNGFLYPGDGSPFYDAFDPEATFRQVYLPSGSEWVNFWTGKKYSGGQTLSVPCSIDEIPLFVRSGSIIPMGPLIQYAAEAADPVEIRIYPGADGSFTLYEDENDNYDYENGIYSTIGLNWDDKNNRLIIDNSQGKFPGQLQNRIFHVVRVTEERGTGVKPVQNPDRTVQYDGKRKVIVLD